MNRLVLEPSEIQEIQAVLNPLLERFDSTESAEFQRQATLTAHQLPTRLRMAVYEFKLEEPREALLLVSGLPVDEEKIGPTPAHWKHQDHRSRILDFEMVLVMLGSLLGECIGWATQQDGLVVHDILPIKEHANEQLGSGSDELLTWHTEDAFHPYRSDYIGLGCLRNPQRAVTTFGPLANVNLSKEHVEELMKPLYTIRPDNSHLAKNQSEDRQDDGAVSAYYREIERMLESPDKIALLYGDPARPYLRIDPYFMDPPEEPAAKEALKALEDAIENGLEDLVLQPGDIALIDNYQAVHGRKPFKARFDGTDRWLKRVCVVRDLRKSRTARSAAHSRIIG